MLELPQVCAVDIQLTARLATVVPPASVACTFRVVQIMCALLNQNSEGRRFSFLNARRVITVADPPEGEVRREERSFFVGRVIPAMFPFFSVPTKEACLVGL